MARGKKLKPIVLPKEEPKQEKTIEINVVPKTRGHKDYLRSMCEKDITICTGPPGCCKTYFSVGLGLQKVFQYKEFEKMIISRPVVYSNKSGLGFLPGTVSEKMAPFLLPIYNTAKKFLADKPDFLSGKVGTGDYNKNPIIEIIPVHDMLGLTFENSWVLIDEAQNCSFSELRTIISRLGAGSKIVISGDPKQATEKSELYEIIDRIGNISNVGVVELGSHDIMRHPKLAEIVAALEAP